MAQAGSIAVKQFECRVVDVDRPAERNARRAAGVANGELATGSGDG